MKRKSNGNNLSDVLAAAEEGLHALRSGRSLVTKHVEIPEPPRFTARRVAQVRRRLGVDQTSFARLIGASPETVRSWEKGVKVPSGIAARLLQIAEREPEVLTRSLASVR